MTNDCVMALLDSTRISREEDFAVPINGEVKPLPYIVARSKVTVDGDDLGRVRFLKTEWIVALFTTNRNDSLEAVIIKALAPVGRIEIERFPDGRPYQTNFEFTTKTILK